MPHGGIAIARWCVAEHCCRFDPRTVEDTCHVPRMVRRDTEPQRLRAQEVAYLVTNSVEDDAGTSVVATEEIRQFAGVVASPLPVDPAQVHPIGHGEVVKGCEQIRLEGI